MSRSDPIRADDYLGHIIEAIDNISEYTEDMDLVAFLLDKKTQDAVIRNFEIIGEACNNVTKHHGPFAAAHPQVPWNFAYEMRNALSHGYFKVDQQIVWQTIGDDLPGLRQAVQAAKMSPKQ